MLLYFTEQFLPSSTIAALIVRLVKRMPTTIAISFLQTSAFAAVDRSASRQGPKVAWHGFLMVVHAVRSRPIVTMRLRGITMIDDFSGAVVHVAPMFSRQAAVEILRRVNRRFAQGFIVPAVIASICISLRGKRGVDIVTSFWTATQMFSQPLSYATTSTASSMIVLNTIGVGGLVSVIKRTKQYCLRLYRLELRSITFFNKHALSFHCS